MSELLDLVCASCMGTQVNGLTEEPCITCDGWGHLPTDAGEQLIAFLERHGFKRSMSPRDEVNLGNMLEK